MSPFLVSIAVFSITFVIMISEKLNRSVIALFGALLMVALGLYMDFYSFEQVLRSIDFNTIVLLFGMMVFVAVLDRTGFFQYLAIKTAKKTKGSLWLLTVCLGSLTSLLSMILDNVTTIILIVPVTLIISRLLKLNATPILIAEAILSNVGGVATLVGDPPNIIIGSAAGFSFNDFLIHSFPVVLLAWIAVLLYIRFSFRDEFKAPAKNIHSLAKIDERKSITDMKTLIKTLIILSLVIIFFLFHSMLGLPPSFIALFGAGLLILFVSPHKDPKIIFKKLEFHVLIFFVSLFVLVGGLESAGVLDFFVDKLLYNASHNILLTAIVVMWISAIISAIVDNIPITVAMIPILGALEAKGIYGIDLIWWAMVFGVGFGGTATPIGSTAGVIVMAKSESTRHPIHTKLWMKNGLPAALISLSIASYMMVVFYRVFIF